MSEAREKDCFRQAAEALGAALLVGREGSGGKFSLAGSAPDWWPAVFGSETEFRERSPFLDDFISGAAAELWRSHEESEGRGALRSGIWEENGPGASEDEGRRYFFDAVAAGSEASGSVLLMILPADDRWREEQVVVQNAHEQSLNRRRLLRELEKKQILLECVMHDLGNPVATVLMNLQHMDRHLGAANESLRPAVRRAMAQTERQRQLIRSIAEVFAADLSGDREQLLGNAPELVSVAAETVTACAPLAADAGVILCPFFGAALPVVGERLALSRVIENLLVNAIRHSSKGQRVKLNFESENGFAICRVEDEGTGIDPDIADSLFRPFVSGKEDGGQSGLGLYFCRMTIEMWGGRIEVRDSESGGACFEFRLPLADGRGERS
ncbi:MAG: HAMP domain-containing histidine kinase [Verrucomicrobiae bacterium]|nr:HAMP domain-containing histidine kinase [Verrucomicrobiae bacterium]